MMNQMPLSRRKRQPQEARLRHAGTHFLYSVSQLLALSVVWTAPWSYQKPSIVRQCRRGFLAFLKRLHLTPQVFQGTLFTQDFMMEGLNFCLQSDCTYAIKHQNSGVERKCSPLVEVPLVAGTGIKSILQTPTLMCTWKLTPVRSVTFPPRWAVSSPWIGLHLLIRCPVPRMGEGTQQHGSQGSGQCL